MGLTETNMPRDEAPSQGDANPVRSGGMASLRWGWVALLIFLVVPLYVLAVVLVIRSNLFRSSDPLNGEQLRALWAFLGIALTATIAALGHLFTRSWHEKDRAQQHEAEAARRGTDRMNNAQLRLETVARSLELLKGNEAYAPPAVVAGALATLVHLGYPIVAMRTLSSAWRDEAVDADAACWLISEVFNDGSAASQVEAAGILRSHANQLAHFNEGQNVATFAWPHCLLADWPENLPPGARAQNLETLILVILSLERKYWRPNYVWCLTVLAAATNDPDPAISTAARQLLAVMAVKVDGRALPPHISAALAKAAKSKDEQTLDFVASYRQAIAAWNEDRSIHVSVPERQQPSDGSGGVSASEPDHFMATTMKISDDAFVPSPLVVPTWGYQPAAIPSGSDADKSSDIDTPAPPADEERPMETGPSGASMDPPDRSPFQEAVPESRPFLLTTGHHAPSLRHDAHQLGLSVAEVRASMDAVTMACERVWAVIDESQTTAQESPDSDEDEPATQFEIGPCDE